MAPSVPGSPAVRVARVPRPPVPEQSRRRRTRCRFDALSVARDGIDHMTQSAVISNRIPAPRPLRCRGAEPTAEQLRVIEHRGRRLRVLAGPGTGKSSTLVEAVAERIRRGVPPEQILVLTFSRRAAAELTARITRGWASPPGNRWCARCTGTRSRCCGRRRSGPASRHRGCWRRASPTRWCANCWPASGKRRGAGPTRSVAPLARRLSPRSCGTCCCAPPNGASRRAGWPIWAAAGGARNGRPPPSSPGSTRTSPTSGRAPAGSAPRWTRPNSPGPRSGCSSDDSVLAAEQSRIRRIFVDEYQDVDPAQARLVERLASGADELVVFGDPGPIDLRLPRLGPRCAAGHRRGPDGLVSPFPGGLAPAVLLATRRVAERLPGAWPIALRSARHRRPTRRPFGHATAPGSGRPPGPRGGGRPHPADGRPGGRVHRRRVAPGAPAGGRALVADGGAGPVAGAALPALRRAFATAGVPIGRLRTGHGVDRRPGRGVAADACCAAGNSPTMLTGQVALN